MNRKEFFKKTCGIGACACILPALLKAETSAIEGVELTRKEKFVQHRFTK